MTPNQSFLTWESIKSLPFEVNIVIRSENYFRCELHAAKGSRCGSYLVVHTPYALDFDQVYTPEELKDFPIWINGHKLPKMKSEGIRVVKRKKGLALIKEIE